jgi:hypothetical protein
MFAKLYHQFSPDGEESEEDYHGHRGHGGKYGHGGKKDHGYGGPNNERANSNNDGKQFLSHLEPFIIVKMSIESNAMHYKLS